MTEHSLFRVMRSTPVDAAARRVVSQGVGISDDSELSREELIAITDRLERKRRLLKLVLGIEKRTHSKNLVQYVKGVQNGLGKRGSGVNRVGRNPRAAIEYVRLGEEIQRMKRRLQELRAERKGRPVGEMHGWSPTE